MLKKTEIAHLFEKFSFPLTNPCISPSQREKAIGIAKILWLPLVTDSDSHQEIQTILQRIVPHKPDDEQSLGALYFYKMRTALTQKDIRKLRAYYRVPEHFNTLKDWIGRDALEPNEDASLSAE